MTPELAQAEIIAAAQQRWEWSHLSKAERKRRTRMRLVDMGLTVHGTERKQPYVPRRPWTQKVDGLRKSDAELDRIAMQDPIIREGRYLNGSINDQTQKVSA